MSKKYLTSKERSKKRKRILLSVLCALAVISALLIILGISLGKASDYKEKISYEYLRKAMENDYKEDPWDGGPSDSLQSKKGIMWAAFEALMCIEDEGMRGGSKGIEYDTTTGTTLCFDISGFKEEDRPAIEKMLRNYADKKGLSFRTGTKEELIKEGKIDSADQPDIYTEGCLITIDEPEYDDELRCYTTSIFFYYNNRYGKGAVIRSVRNEDWTHYYDENGEVMDKRSDDGVWTSFMLTSIIT